MLVIEPEKRLNLSQIESHKWIKQVTINNIYNNIHSLLIFITF